MKKRAARCWRTVGIFAISLLGAAPAVSLAAAGDVVQSVKARGFLRCGVSEGIVGFSVREGSGLPIAVAQLGVSALCMLALVWLVR